MSPIKVRLVKMTEMESGSAVQTCCISYSFEQSRFGLMLIASTAIGICFIAFVDDDNAVLSHLKSTFPSAIFQNERKESHQEIIKLFELELGETTNVTLHLKGSAFQYSVWQALLKIPFGHLSTYQNIALAIGKPKASRAVGTAIGRNPIAYLIPCHRVIQTSGGIGGYMWGLERKRALLNWERESSNHVKSS